MSHSSFFGTSDKAIGVKRIAVYLLLLVVYVVIVSLTIKQVYENIITQYGAYTPLSPVLIVNPISRRATPTTTNTVVNISNRVYAFGVEWDNSTLESLTLHLDHIDELIMEELTLNPSGVSLVNPIKFKRTQAYLRKNAPNLPLHVLINNHNLTNNTWDTSLLYSNLSDTTKRRDIKLWLLNFAIINNLAGINIDFEEIDKKTYPYYLMFLKELTLSLNALGKKLTVDIPISNSLFNLPEIAKRVNLIFLMAYDEHWSGSTSGSIASHLWFDHGIRSAVNRVSRDKLVVILGNYGYDWIIGDNTAKPLTNRQVQSIIQKTGATPRIDPKTSNPFYYYLDEARRDHVVWYLDNSTIYKSLNILKNLGIKNVALWRLGSEDRGTWEILKNIK
ncbi:hypothetical protein H7169_01965 [Candidatus Gracilibacteria bacterium]|nr:hypothetical protein [Candidatus Gracilibacteria bacterium]